MIECGVCGRNVVHSKDVVPRGWFILYAYNDDDGNNITPYEVCGRECLKIAAWKQQEEIKDYYNE